MKKPLTIALGEVLWDVLPDGKSLGGAPTNVAWHAAQLGADAHVISAVGDDPLGREILDNLKRMRLDVSTVSILPGVPTSTVDARLDAAGNATYTIHENVAWDHLPATADMLALAARADAVNFGSLAQRHPTGRASTHAILDAVNPDAIKVFDINLRPPFIDKEILDAGLRKATVIKMNNDELPVLAGMFGWTGEPESAMTRLLEAYPGVRHLVVTKGADGAWWRSREKLHFKAPPPVERMCDTIGAGDSVTAACMLGLLKGWREDDILAAAMNIASFVCSSRGGTPELPDRIKDQFLG